MNRLPFQPPTAFVLLTLLFPTATGAQEQEVRPLRLHISFQDYAGAPRWQMRDAVLFAQRVFRNANVEIDWLDCTPALHGLPAPSVCHQHTRPTSLVVQLASRRMVRQTPVSKQVFGWAQPSEPGLWATRASLFYDRIQDYSEAHGLNAIALLGMALAHEIGHLLLGPGGHGERGLMSCPWDKADIVDAARGRLSFSPVQRDRIRAGILAGPGRSRRRGKSRRTDSSRPRRLLSTKIVHACARRPVIASGFQPSWPDVLEMDPEVKRRVDGICRKLGIG